MRNNIKKPWQRKALLIITILMLLGSMIMAIMGLYTFLAAFVISQNVTIAVAFLKIMPGILIAIFLSIIILTLLIVGVKQGKRISLYMLLLMGGINFLSSLVGVVSGIVSKSLNNMVLGVLGMGLFLFIVWLVLSCLKHPFYGGTGRLTVDSFKFWKKILANNRDMTTF